MRQQDVDLGLILKAECLTCRAEGIFLRYLRSKVLFVGLLICESVYCKDADGE